MQDVIDMSSEKFRVEWGGTAESRNDFRIRKSPANTFFEVGAVLNLIPAIGGLFIWNVPQVSILFGLLAATLYVGGHLRTIGFYAKYVPLEPIDE